MRKLAIFVLLLMFFSVGCKPDPSVRNLAEKMQVAVEDYTEWVEKIAKDSPTALADPEKTKEKLEVGKLINRGMDTLVESCK